MDVSKTTKLKKKKRKKRIKEHRINLIHHSHSLKDVLPFTSILPWWFESPAIMASSGSSSQGSMSFIKFSIVNRARTGSDSRLGFSLVGMLRFYWFPIQLTLSRMLQRQLTHFEAFCRSQIWLLLPFRSSGNPQASGSSSKKGGFYTTQTTRLFSLLVVADWGWKRAKLKW
jgi:hypothetical protein